MVVQSAQKNPSRAPQFSDAGALRTGDELIFTDGVHWELTGGGSDVKEACMSIRGRHSSYCLL